MKVGIILGFSYTNCKTESLDYNLPGIVLDLYIAYNYCGSIGCEKIMVVTDETDSLANKDQNRYILDLIVGMKVDKKITSFLESLKKQGQLLEFMNIENFHANLSLWAKGASRLIFYYSGHAHHGMALIPKYKHRATYDIAPSQSSRLHVISFIDLIAPIITATSSDCEVLSILDCCSSEALSLPYNLILKVKVQGDDSWRTLPMKDSSLEPMGRASGSGSEAEDVIDFNGSFRLINLDNWFAHRFITAIAVVSAAFSSHSGSSFTEAVVRILLDEQVTSFPCLLFRLRVDLYHPSQNLHDQSIPIIRPQLRSSYPRFIIQPWMKRRTKISIVYDCGYHVFRISH